MVLYPQRRGFTALTSPVIIAQYTAAMRALILIAAIAGLVQAPAVQPTQAPAPPPGTDIYLVPLAGGIASMKNAKPSPVSIAPGYDNQPSFSSDGNWILFAANRDGRQTDIFEFDRRRAAITQRTRTPENENSPTPLPGGDASSRRFSVVQSEFDSNGARPAAPIQRLWRFDAEGKPLALILPDINPVGYHAWIDNDLLVLFVLGAQGKPATLQIANVKTGKAEIAADNIGRSLHRIPNTRLASFVQREASGEYWVKQIDPVSKRIDPLVKAVDGSSDRDMAWLPDGKTMLMSSGTRVFAWTRGTPGWTEVFDAATHQLGPVSRLAVSPQGDAVAIVVAEPEK